jgi:hypothetical protein
MKLNIYDKKEIVKTYEAEEYDLMFGVVEDVANLIDLSISEKGDQAEIVKLVGKVVLNSMETVKSILKDVFVGLTDDELRQTKTVEIIAVAIDIGRYTLKQLKEVARTKN